MSDEEEAALQGSDGRNVRLECLKLAVAQNKDNPLRDADQFARFVMKGEVSDD